VQPRGGLSSAANLARAAEAEVEWSSLGVVGLSASWSNSVLTRLSVSGRVCDVGLRLQ
jgi:hypothetical protein